MSDEEYRQELLNDFDVAAKGAYYGALITAAQDDGRICGVPCDGAAMVDTAWDLGIGDATAIWFVQPVGRETPLHRLLRGERAAAVALCRGAGRRGYPYRDHIVPHDAEAREMQPARRAPSCCRAWASACGSPPSCPSTTVSPPCARSCRGRGSMPGSVPTGIEKLRQYRSEYDEKRQVLSNRPLHDFTCHCLDAFRMYAVTHRDAIKAEMPERRSMGWIV